MAASIKAKPTLVTYKAGEDLRLLQHRFVYLSAEDTVSKATANKRTIGILQNTPNLGEEAIVAVEGQSLLTVDAAYATIGSILKSDANGKGDLADTTKDEVGAETCEASGAADDKIVVFLRRFIATV